MAQTKNIQIFVVTIVAPTGVENIIDTSIPTIAQHDDITADAITTPLKFCIILIAERAGKIISAEIKSEPTRFIANTIIKAVITAINKL